MIINQIGGGTTPTGTKQITTNGTHNVADYEYADVQVPTTAPSRYVEYSVNYSGEIQHSTTAMNIINMSGVSKISSQYMFASAYANNYNVSGVVDFSDVVQIGGGNSCCESMFQSCAGITGVNLSSLTTVNGTNACNNMFSGCNYITNVMIGSLTTVSASFGCAGMFRNCTRLTNINLGSLTTASGSNALERMFAGCTGLTSVVLSALETLGTWGGTCNNMFNGCTSLTSLSFPALNSTSFGTYTNHFNNMLSGVTGCTVHFPSNLQSVIGSWADVINGFGGTNTTVLFDLPATA